MDINDFMRGADSFGVNVLDYVSDWLFGKPMRFEYRKGRENHADKAVRKMAANERAFLIWLARHKIIYKAKDTATTFTVEMNVFSKYELKDIHYDENSGD